MKTRPYSIVILSICFFLVAPITLTAWFYRYNFNPELLVKSFNLSTALLCIGTSIVSVGIWRVRKWGYYTFLTLSLAVMAHQIYQYVTYSEGSVYLSILIAAGFTLASSFLLQKHISAPYFNPRLRWWEHDPRYPVKVTAQFQVDRKIRKGSLLDISLGGCFAELDTKLIVGETIEIRIVLLQFDFATKAKVIWDSETPKGYGLMFINNNKAQKRELKKIISSLSSSSDPNIKRPSKFSKSA